MLAAIAAIAIIVAAVYVFSIVPYLISASQGRRPDQVSPGLEVIIPATALPLILVLVFLVPARRKVGKREGGGEEEQEEKISDAEKKDSAQRSTTIAAATKEDEVEELKERPQSYEQIAEKRFRRSSILAGAIGGLSNCCISSCWFDISGRYIIRISNRYILLYNYNCHRRQSCKSSCHIFRSCITPNDGNCNWSNFWLSFCSYWAIQYHESSQRRRSRHFGWLYLVFLVIHPYNSL